MEDLRRQASELQLALRLGLVERAYIINWADSIIASLESPPIEVIDLALMTKAHAQDIVGKLGEISGEVAVWATLPQVFSQFAAHLRKNPSLGPGVAKGLWSLYAEAGYESPKEFNFAASIDEDYHLAKTGIYGTEAAVFEDLMSCIEAYQKENQD